MSVVAYLVFLAAAITAAATVVYVLHCWARIMVRAENEGRDTKEAVRWLVCSLIVWLVSAALALLAGFAYCAQTLVEGLS